MAVNLVVAPSSEPTAVEACLNDELVRAAAELPSLISGKPVARLIDVTDAGQVWSAGLQVADVEAQGPAGHELRKRLLARLRREGIALGIPTLVIHEAPGGTPGASPRGTSDPKGTP
jgi:small-conductance mechanosensitive channel